MNGSPTPPTDNAAHHVATGSLTNSYEDRGQETMQPTAASAFPQTAFMVGPSDSEYSDVTNDATNDGINDETPFRVHSTWRDRLNAFSIPSSRSEGYQDDQIYAEGTTEQQTDVATEQRLDASVVPARGFVVETTQGRETANVDGLPRAGDTGSNGGEEVGQSLEDSVNGEEVQSIRCSAVETRSKLSDLPIEVTVEESQSRMLMEESARRRSSSWDTLIRPINRYLASYGEDESLPENAGSWPFQASSPEQQDVRTELGPPLEQQELTSFLT
jgi:hypothetical protein